VLSREQLRRRVAAYVGDYGMNAAEAAKVTDEVVREIDEDEEDWEADVKGRVEVARRRVRDADLLRRGFTLEQLEPFRLHYSR
jgi:polyhydroxyalkanoate synthesis regulator phasin